MIPTTSRRSIIVEALVMGATVLAIIGVLAWALTHQHPAAPAPVLPSKPLADPLIYKSKGHLRVVRAVFQNKLYLLVFEHRAGVWFLDGVKPAAEIKS